jgi:hypothetical protein
MRNSNNRTDNKNTDGNIPKVQAPQERPKDINSPTVTGFTAEDPGLTNAAEVGQKGRLLSLDEATNLRAALSNVIGYQTGTTYRHDFEAGLEVLRAYDFTYNVDRADADATKAQEEVFANERGELNAQDKGEDNKGDDSAAK